MGTESSGRWIERTEREGYIEVYSEYIKLMDAKYPDIDDMVVAGEAEEYIEKREELARLSRIQRCEGNLLEFAIEYFSDARNDGNDGNWGGFDIEHVEEAAEFHRELTGIMDDVSTNKVNAQIAAAISRGHAKSTYLSRAFPISEVVFRKRKYIINISETPTVAKTNMEFLRNQLKYNRKLRADFGPLLSPKDQSNLVDNSEEFIAWHPDGESKRQIAIVQAASTGQALRGRNWNGNRPDLVIMDDLEDSRVGGNASTEEQRTKLKEWMTQTVMALGDPKGEKTAYILMGTTVHRKSLLMHVLHERADFDSTIYRAVIDEPIRSDLWEECRQIYIDRNIPNRAEEARKFYLEHKEEMNEGVKVLWPDVQPIWKLMTWKWSNGSKAFNTEYQNNPIDVDSMIFDPQHFKYYEGEIDHMNGSYDVSLGVDVAMGKRTHRGDFSALTIVARHKESGINYIIDSYIERINPAKLIDVIVEKVQEYQPTIIAAEAVAMQEYIVDEMKMALMAVGYPAHTRVKKIYHRSRKELRIEAMLPSIENETIQFKREHVMLLEQFEGYGQGEHDDGPDSMEMSVSALEDSESTVRTVSRMNRW